MINRKLIIIVILLFFSSALECINAIEKPIKLFSPNGKLEVHVYTYHDTLCYSILYNGTSMLMEENKIALVLADGSTLGKMPSVKSKEKRTIKEDIESPLYRFSSFSSLCNELKINFKGNYGVFFRAYNEGIAYRFYTCFKKDIKISNEVAEFNFDKDYIAYLPYSTNEKQPFAMAFQNTYDITPLSKAQHLPAFLPVTIDYGDELKVTLLESDLEAYPGMFVLAGNKSLKGVFAPLPSKTNFYPWRKQEYVTEYKDIIAECNGKRSFPWRIIAVTHKDTEMPVNNLVYALASPNRIEDTSWIKSGQVAWDWWNDWGLKYVSFKAGINTDTYKYYIDFAARNGIKYIIIDEGWYDSKNGDMLTTVPSIDLPILINYAKDRGVDVILWTVFNVLDSQLDLACKKYSAMGVKGFKVDFLDRDDQNAVKMVYRIAEMAAKYKMILDLHGMYKPTGFNRTYPNIVNVESVFGMEEVKWSSVERNMPRYDVIFPYIRMMAGFVDYTPGAMRNATRKDFSPIFSNPMSMGTRSHQLAAYVIHDSPLTMLCDSPTNYQIEQECLDLITSIPTKIDETRILAGTLGEYIVSARRKGKNWYIGGMTNWNARNVHLNFSFLDDDAFYCATIFQDGINANKEASDYRKICKEVTRQDTLSIRLASGGGFVIRLEKVCAKSKGVLNVPDSLHLSPFYKKYVDAGGIAVVSSDKVQDEALLTARKLIIGMLMKRKDIRDYMSKRHCRFMVIGEHENVSDIPEYAHICSSPEKIAFWNKRARGFGGAPEDSLSSSCGEENLLCLSGDRYQGENILIHEFAHLIHTVGIVDLESDFNKRLELVMDHAEKKGLWRGTYAISNKEEYFAETVQTFFNCNRYSREPNGVHNSINRREKLKVYDPDMYNLLKEYFYESDLPIKNEVHP